MNLDDYDFKSMFALPTVVTGPGRYLTRSGETVTVTIASARYPLGCSGAYPIGVAESWHQSGRIYDGRITQNDIVALAVE